MSSIRYKSFKGFFFYIEIESILLKTHNMSLTHHIIRRRPKCRVHDKNRSKALEPCDRSISMEEQNRPLSEITIRPIGARRFSVDPSESDIHCYNIFLKILIVVVVLITKLLLFPG